MARAIWTGSVSFGLVNIPVGLYSAVSEKTIRFNQLEKGTSSRIRYKRVNESTGEEVPYENIVKGYDVGGGQYVVLTQKELEAVEPSGTRNIEIEEFVDQAEIDPIFYNQTYYVAPKNEAAARPYALLIEAMRTAGKVAIARFVLRSREYLAALRPDGDVLALETMYFADEIRDPIKEVDVLPSGEAVRERELSTAISLIESMSSKWDPTNYHDRYRERVEELIEQKLHGQETVTVRPQERDTNVVDLMEALRRSVEQVREGRSGANGKAEEGSASRGATASSEVENRSEKALRGAKQPAKKSRPASARAATGKREGKRSRARDGRPKPEQLAMMSREELYQLAQDIDLPGRSKMTREQLVEAVSEGSRRAS
jgi:DNA end-binding protein Ku